MTTMIQGPRWWRTSASAIRSGALAGVGVRHDRDD